MASKRSTRSVLAATALALLTAAPSGAAVVVYDDFTRGFSTAPGAKWSLASPHPSHTADDGVVRTESRRLLVRASGTHPVTGEPAFVRTMAQEDDNAFGLHGQLDHDKWAAAMTRRFDARPGAELTFEATVTGRTFGTAGHPFGPAVADPPTDPRLAAVRFGAADPDTHLHFDFLLTDGALYALYARTPEGRTAADPHAAFTALVPLGPRTQADQHRLAVAYDRRAGTVRWVVDGRERFRVDRVGRRPDRRFVVLEHGGADRDVAPAQLTGGMGTATLLDAGLDGGHGLVRLSNLPAFYFDPRAGEPTPQLFLDNASFDSSRVYGQGAAFAMGPVLVSDQGPVCGRLVLPLGLGALVDPLACELVVRLSALLQGTS